MTASLVRRSLGQTASWVFIAIVAGLSGFGIYLGRVLRFNSWDVLLKPFALTRSIGHWATDPLAYPASFVFPALFATFMFVAYVLLYALTHLQQAQPFTLQTTDWRCYTFSEGTLEGEAQGELQSSRGIMRPRI